MYITFDIVGYSRGKNSQGGGMVNGQAHTYV